VEKDMKFKSNDILILGDSFCSAREEPTDWPMVVSQKLTGYNHIPRGVGFAGGSWWSVRRALLEEIQKGIPKVLILCHTEANRIPNNYNLGINYGSVRDGRVDRKRCKEDISEEKLQRIIEAGKLYYEELWSLEYCRWAQKSWFRELDQMIEKWCIPYVIHLRCFADSSDYIFKNSITIQEALVSIQSHDPSIPSLMHNHFSDDLNQKFGNKMVELILNYETGRKKLNLPVNYPKWGKV
jgi:hypothetical protein